MNKTDKGDRHQFLAPRAEPLVEGVVPSAENIGDVATIEDEDPDLADRVDAIVKKWVALLNVEKEQMDPSNRVETIIAQRKLIRSQFKTINDQHTEIEHLKSELNSYIKHL